MVPLFRAACCCLVAAMLLGTATPVRAQKGGESARQPSLSSQQREENSALFVEAVKDRLCEDYEVAEKKFRSVLVTDPSHDAAHYELAILMVLKGDLQEALNEASVAERLDDKNPWYKLMMGDLYNQTRQFSLSEPYWRQLADMFPENIEYQNNYAMTLLEQQKLKEAIAVYDRMEKLLGPDEQLIEAKKSIYLYLNKVEEAAQEIKTLADAYPNDPKYLVEVADIYRVNRQMKKAVPYLEAACRLDSNNARVLGFLYDYYLEQQKEREAYAILEKLFVQPEVSFDFKKAVMSNFFLSYLKDTTLYSRTFHLAELLSQSHPQEGSVWALKADVLITKNKYDDAIACLQQSLSLDSSQYRVWQAYLQLLVHRRSPELCSASERALSLYPEQVYPHVAHAVCMIGEDEHAEAILDLEDALRRMPDDFDPHMRVYVYGLLMKLYDQEGDAEKLRQTAEMLDRLTAGMPQGSSEKQKKSKKRKP